MRLHVKPGSEDSYKNQIKTEMEMQSEGVQSVTLLRNIASGSDGPSQQQQQKERQSTRLSPYCQTQSFVLLFVQFCAELPDINILVPWRSPKTWEEFVGGSKVHC
ncbi:hypothetical protein GOP47_0008438 [Adiantum capillus-veneris]|uniref:Uncharacterized protein n=1 Tax=Adiantum capillus-veneris TaxID=13818 RepID=A0A9D4ZI19_ADICA|nr:hypothetical protein GOP47_0008438 [Adiantum capillus-veneris]